MCVCAFAVYAVALYVDDKGMRRALHKFKGQPAGALAANQTFFDGVTALRCAASLDTNTP